jgi:hypothetical protein
MSSAFNNNNNGNYSLLVGSNSVYNNVSNSLVMGTSSLQRIRLEASSGVGRFRSGTSTSGFDFAELFENGTGEEIASGLLVTLEGNKVIPANDGDKVIGVVSHTYGFLGNGSDLH